MGRIEMGEFKHKIHNDTPYTYIIYFGGVVHTRLRKTCRQHAEQFSTDDKLLFV